MGKGFDGERAQSFQGLLGSAFKGWAGPGPGWQALLTPWLPLTWVGLGGWEAPNCGLPDSTLLGGLAFPASQLPSPLLLGHLGAAL